MRATYAKLTSGKWGVRVTGAVPSPGTTVVVTKKDGSTRTEVIEKVVWQGEGVALCTIREQDVETRICWECGRRFTYAECKRYGGEWRDNYCGC